MPSLTGPAVFPVEEIAVALGRKFACENASGSGAVGTKRVREARVERLTSASLPYLLRFAVEALLGEVRENSRSAPGTRPEVAALDRVEAPMEASDLWTAVGRAAPEDALFVSEAGSNEVPMTKSVRPGAPLSHISAVGGGLGFGLPAAVGAQLGAPDRPVVALMGDGSMRYAITALWTAARYKIPVKIVVASNEEYAVLKQFGDIESTPGVPGLDLPGLNITATAASCGIDAHEATNSDEVSEMLSKGVMDRSARP